MARMSSGMGECSPRSYFEMAASVLSHSSARHNAVMPRASRAPRSLSETNPGVPDFKLCLAPIEGLVPQAAAGRVQDRCRSKYQGISGGGLLDAARIRRIDPGNR